MYVKLFSLPKESLISGLFVSALSFSTFAQVSVGTRMGVNLNQFTMPGTTIGATLGAFSTIKVNSILTARLEVLYSQEGGGLRDYFLPTNANDPSLPDFLVNVASVNYINPYVYMHSMHVPILAELSLPEYDNADILPVLLLGGSYNLMFRADELHTTRYTFIDGTFSDIPYLRENVTSSYEANQFSAVGGLGIKFKGGRHDFYFDIRYRQGLTQLNNIKHTLTYKDGRLYSSTLSISFSISLLNY